MAGLFGTGGSAAKTDRKRQLDAWGILQSIGGQLGGYGKQAITAGMGGVDKAKDYWTALMSGDPSRMGAVLGPQLATIRGQAGQNINTLQQFSGRSGGTSAAVQEVNVEAQRAIQNLFDLLGPTAAQEFGQLSEFESGLGAELFGQDVGAISTIGQQATGSRQTTAPLQQAQQGAVLGTLGSILGLA